MPVYTYTTIDEPRANFRTDPTAINDAGTIVGTYADLTGNHGFLYSGGTYATLDAPGATQTRASGINASGLIVGDYFDGASQGHVPLQRRHLRDPRRSLGHHCHRCPRH
jgi:probable HAF family extracellular repeat protein